GRAQARGQVERAAPVPARDRLGLTRVEAAADGERERAASLRDRAQPTLQLDRRAQRGPGGAEGAQRLVASRLDELAAVLRRSAPGGVRERTGQRGSRLVATLPGVARIPVDARDEERPQASRGRVRLLGGLRTRDG